MLRMLPTSSQLMLIDVKTSRRTRTTLGKELALDGGLHQDVVVARAVNSANNDILRHSSRGHTKEIARSTPAIRSANREQLCD